MKIKQISIFIENRAGRLAEVTGILGKANVNIRALSLADTSNFGILRLIVNDVNKAISVLKESGFTVGETDVIAVEVPDVPGGLAQVLEHLRAESINVEYMYAFVEKTTDNAILIFKIEDLDRAIKVLQDKRIRILKGEEVYSL